jgi:hypothetical protein
MNARRWAAVHARGKVMMRAPSAAGELMPPMLAPAGSATQLPNSVPPMTLLAGRIQTGPRRQLRHEADPTMVETHEVRDPPSWLVHRACLTTPQRAPLPYLGRPRAHN